MLNIILIAKKIDVFTDMFYNHFSKKHNIKIVDNIRRFSKENVDVIWSLGLRKATLSGAISDKKILFIVSPLGTDIGVDVDMFFKGHIMKYLLGKADLLFPQDVLGRGRLLDLGVSKDKIEVCPWGVDLNVFKPNGSKKTIDVLNTFGINKLKYGVNVLDNAIGIIRNTKPEIKYRVVSGIKHDEMPRLYNESNVFVDCYQPPKNNGGHSYGISLLEAMACGVPTVVVDRPTVRLEGKHKWYYGLATKSNSKELAYNIGSLLDDRIMQSRIIDDNLKMMKERFDWDKNIKAIEEKIMERVK